MRELSIYIHIPYCVRKCLYCDFLSFPVGSGLLTDSTAMTDEGSGLDRKGPGGQTVRDIESYVNLLKREITLEADRYSGHQVISVFWGGGTPSLLGAAAVTEVIETLRNRYHMAADVEITIEANPGTVTADKLREYITAGINRISIGLQSADDRELARIGRIHDYRAFLETYKMAREAGFGNINIDLMAALPGQSVKSYEETLRRVAALCPEHISAYSLILEEGTPLYERQGEYRFPTEEEDREMYLLTDSCLASCGYHRYEISNYAREGFECRHNKVYWQRGDYVGFGLGAASMVDNIRWSNPTEPEKYVAYVTGLEKESDKTTGKEDGQASAGKTGGFPVRQILTGEEQMEEFMFLGLRMTEGVSPLEFQNSFGKSMEEVYGPVIEKNMRDGLLEYRGRISSGEPARLALTGRGLDVSNMVMAQFLFP